MAEARLTGAGFESARIEAQSLAAHILRVDRAWLYAHPEHEFNDLAGESLLQRRESHEPLAYIVGVREFYGRPFGVSPAVLVPRHEKETLVETVLRRFGPNPLRVLDIGTGSGCIAVTVKLECPAWEVTAVDVSPDALAIASANARFLGARVGFVHSDLFGGLLGESFDLIVCNPPYIATDEPLPRDVAEFEPALALFAANDGYAFYERLALEGPDHLEDGGAIAVEVGYRQADRVRSIFENAGWTWLETVLDLGGVPRVVVCGHAFEGRLP